MNKPILARHTVAALGKQSTSASTSAPRFVFPISLVALALIACSSSSRGDASQVSSVDLPDTCGAYLARYESCLTSLTPQAPGIAKARTTQARDALVASLTHDSPANVSESCSANLSRLASCGH